LVAGSKEGSGGGQEEGDSGRGEEGGQGRPLPALRAAGLAGTAAGILAAAEPAGAADGNGSNGDCVFRAIK
jgi:hypothetical protein